MEKNNLVLDKNCLDIFHEGRKRRTFVANLWYNNQSECYELQYDKEYVISPTAISLGPELDIFTLKHTSEKNKMFKSILDRIPSADNPAYKDYCKSQGISVDEKNPIILLGSIGRRGPSNFIFEPLYINEFGIADIKQFREQTGITQHDLAIALDISIATLQRIESGSSHDTNTLYKIQTFIQFPSVAYWQIIQTGRKLHSNSLLKFYKYISYKRDYTQ